VGNVGEWKKKTPIDPMPMGAKRKEEYPRGSTLLTPVFSTANPMPSIIPTCGAKGEGWEKFLTFAPTGGKRIAPLKAGAFLLKIVVDRCTTSVVKRE